MDYYDGISSGYDELHGDEQRSKLALIKDRLVVWPDDLALDVGCGTGLSSDLGCRVVGLDPSREMLEKAKAEAVQASAEDIPFPDAHFDIVISVTAIQNFKDIPKGLDEIKRVGKGCYVLTVLKRSPKAREIDALVRERFPIAESVEEDKDIIYFSCGRERLKQ